MKTSEIRDELLAQHASLRGRLEAARLTVARWRTGAAPQIRVRDELSAIADALRSHNLLEERSLRDIVRRVDAWGPARKDILEEEHIREHRELHDALVRIARATDAQRGADAFDGLRAHLLAHMAREEKAFLNESVLRDDDVAIDATDG